MSRKDVAPAGASKPPRLALEPRKPAKKITAQVEPLGSDQERSRFTERAMAWGRSHGRTGLPWQVKDAYAVWVSEIMLQQTQVETAKRYYEKFLDLWPTPASLAAASEDDVLSAWAGLGYYRRAKFLHRGAKKVVSDFQGKMPTTAAELATLPGIGRSTAAAIASIAFGRREAIMDGNVVRVLTRQWGFGADPMKASSQKVLWATAQALVDSEDPGFYTQTIMDLGATVCSPKSPKCAACPVSAECVARARGLQSAYPAKAPKTKERRVESEKWIAWHDGKRLALSKNEALSGVWQSMMVLGAMDPDAVHPPSVLSEAWDFKHSFSHYDLLARVESRLMDPQELDECADRWGWELAAWERALSMALPTPVRDVALKIKKSQEET